MSVANILTLIRIFVCPIFVLLYVKHDALGIPYSILPYILLSLLCISELSDAFDGYIARRMNQVTDLGKVLDPMADSISRIAFLLSFTTGPISLSIFYVFIIFYRDCVISTLRTVCAMRGFALAARTSGKIKAILQSIVIFVIVLTMIPHALGLIHVSTLRLVASWGVFVATLYTIYSGMDYLYANWSYVRNLLQGASAKSHAETSLSQSL